MQNAQAAEAATAPIVEIAAANAAVGETAVAASAEAVTGYTSLDEAVLAAAVATKNLASAQLELGASAREGNATAAAIIAEYRAELLAAQEAVQTFSAAQAEETASVSAGTAAIAGNTAALEANTAAEYSRAEAMGVARVSAGLATGSIGSMDMGLARLAATSSTLGPILQAALPFAIIGAGIFIIAEMGEALYKAFDPGGERARKTSEEIRGVTNDIERSTTSLNVQIDKLQQEQAKLEHVPFNGTKLVLDEAAESAAKLAEQLDRVIDKEIKAIAGMSASLPQRLLGGSSTHDEQHAPGAQQMAGRGQEHSGRSE